MLANTTSKTHRRIVLILLVLVSIPWIIPLASLVIVSFSGDGIGNYREVLSLELIPNFFFNSTIITGFTLAVRMFIVTLAAYAFSKINFKGRGVLFLITIIGLFTPPFTLMVSLFQTVRGLGLLNNWLGVALPLTAFGISFNTLLFKTYFDSIPDALFDAAEIDGANHWTKYRVIILPLGKPIIFTGMIFTFLNSWNEFFLPLIFIRRAANFPITLAPYYFMSAYTSDFAKVYAAMVIISLPIILVYILGQKYLQSGLTGGAVKGE